MKGSHLRNAEMALFAGLALAVAANDTVLAQQYTEPYGNPNGKGWRQGDRPAPGGGGPHSVNGWGARGRRFGGFGFGGMAGLLITAGAVSNAEQSPPPEQRKRWRQTEKAHEKDRQETQRPRPAPPSARAFVHPAPPPPPPPKAIVRAAPQPPPPTPRVAANFHLPRGDETRFRPGEVLVETAPSVSPGAIDAILRAHRLTEAEVSRIGLTGQSLRLWRFPASRAVPGVVRELGGETALASIQPNYIYAPQDDAVKAAPPADEYWLAKLDLDQPLDLAGPQPVRVAVIDTAIDKSHPDLKGSIEDQYDAISEGGGTYTLAHGTSMAGAIAAHGWLKGVAPTVRILSVRALDHDDHGLELGSTQSVMKAIQWAFDHSARILNMSFAGPEEDPALHDELASAHAKGVVLVAAAGNDGPTAAPRYPAADENVVAVTATDASDAVYAMANAGSYIAIAAPGVDVLLTAPKGGYAMQTGTSVSAALVSGVAALLIERSPSAKPTDVRAWLATTARPLALPAAKNAVGAGLVNARGAADAAARSAQPAVAGAKPPGS
jgi:hypothetical protein